jgi:hypothetical protein
LANFLMFIFYFISSAFTRTIQPTAGELATMAGRAAKLTGNWSGSIRNVGNDDHGEHCRAFTESWPIIWNKWQLLGMSGKRVPKGSAEWRQ